MRVGSGYERELRSLLEGDRAAITEYGRRISSEERSTLGRLTKSPFLVVRAAGSFGFDLVALRDSFAIPFEVKSSRSETIRFSAAGGRAEDQLADHRRVAGRAGLVVIYAFRRIGGPRSDAWRMFLASGVDGGGWRRIVRRHVPELEQTREGNGVLRWERGLPLVQFVGHLLDVFDAMREPSS